MGDGSDEKNGVAMPMPNARKIEKISAGPRANAKPIAVPKNGAEHGVARMVAKTPLANELLALWGFLTTPPAPPPIHAGNRSSNRPHKFAANRVIRTVITTMNNGCWN